MLLIPCPVCGERQYTEFTYGGDASQAHPADPSALSDREWTDFLYWRDNPCGPHLEYWHHTMGCRRWLRVARNTRTHDVAAVDDLEPTPEAP